MKHRIFKPKVPVKHRTTQVVRQVVKEQVVGAATPVDKSTGTGNLEQEPQEGAKQPNHAIRKAPPHIRYDKYLCRALIYWAAEEHPNFSMEFNRGNMRA